MTDVTREELLALRAKIDAALGPDVPAPAPEPPPPPPPPPKTYVMVDGVEVPNELEPAETDLQGAYRYEPPSRKDHAGKIVIDMAAALHLAQDLVRAAREPAFTKNDRELRRAERTDDTAAVDAAKVKGQMLADAPADPRLSAAKTPGELLAAVEAITAEF